MQCSLAPHSSGYPFPPAVLVTSGAPAVVHFNSTSISMHWGPPRDFPQLVQSYVLQYTTQSLLVPVHVITYNTTLTHVTVNNLVPYTDYAFKVAVVSEAGQGEWSNSTLQRTEAFSECTEVQCISVHMFMCVH